MDTGNGHLKMLDEQEKVDLLRLKPRRTDIFTIGEEVEVRDSRFRIVKITPKKITLRILPRKDQ